MNGAMILAVGLGGALGSIARYAFMTASGRMMGLTYPWGTFGVNVLGSFAMGLLVGIFAQLLPVNPVIRNFLTVGFLGGFTTFSTFSLDVVALLDRGAWLAVTLYVGGSVVLSVLGLQLGRQLIRMVA